jgi:hypothetical protein
LRFEEEANLFVYPMIAEYRQSHRFQHFRDVGGQIDSRGAHGSFVSPPYFCQSPWPALSGYLEIVP